MTDTTETTPRLPKLEELDEAVGRALDLDSEIEALAERVFAIINEEGEQSIGWIPFGQVAGYLYSIDELLGYAKTKLDKTRKALFTNVQEVVRHGHIVSAPMFDRHGAPNEWAIKDWEADERGQRFAAKRGIPMTAWADTTSPPTVTLPASALIEAVAFMDALSGFLGYIVGGQDCPLEELPREAAWELYAAAFGDRRDLANERTPERVETNARMEELEAELIRRFFGDVEERAQRSIETAALIRSTNNPDAMLPRQEG